MSRHRLERDDPEATAGRVLRWVWRTHGLWLIGSAVVLGAGGYIVLGQLAAVAEALETEGLSAATWVGSTLAARGWIALPAVIIAGCGVLTSRSRWPLLWIAVGAMLITVLAAVMLLCVVGTFAPMYRMPEL